jgi:hypothetical protein
MFRAVGDKVVLLIAAGLQDHIEQRVFVLYEMELFVDQEVLIVAYPGNNEADQEEDGKGEKDLFSEANVSQHNASISNRRDDRRRK